MTAIDILMGERAKLIAERDLAFAMATKTISGIEGSIEQLSGKKVWEVESEVLYEDISPDYIKGTEDGI